jgi:enterochelin esterase family protein
LIPGLAIYTFTVDGVTMPDPVNPRIKLRARTSASLVDVPGDPPELWQARDVPHGTAEVNWEKSKVIGDTRAYYVYTPPGLRSEPIYALSGAVSPARQQRHRCRVDRCGQSELHPRQPARGKESRADGHRDAVGPCRFPTAACSRTTRPTFERYLIEEVIPQVEKKYRVARGRENRAIVGLSMGGGHALQIGLSHLELFSAVGAFSSAVPGNFENRFKSLLDDPAGTNAKLKLLWIGCGRQDSAFERNQKLSELLTNHKIKNTFHPTEGLHNYAVWRRYLVEVAPMLFCEDGNRSGAKD